MALNSIRIVRKLNAASSPAVLAVVTDIFRWANAQGVHILDADEPSTEETLFIAVGGDGTVIHAAKQSLVAGASVLGFNLGKVGFLADFDTTRVYATLHQAFEGTLAEEERTVVRMERNPSDTDGNAWEPDWVALNDFAISCVASDTTMQYELNLNSYYAGTHTANGVLIATPTGSTAYSLNVGGAIIMPSANVMQVLPIAPQSLTSRPLIVPGDNLIEIKFIVTKDRPVNVRADGQVVRVFNNQYDDPMFVSVKVEEGIKKVKLLHDDSWNHFDVLNKKLNWNR